MSETNIIQVTNLKKSYKSVKAVKGISFRVKKGELFAFLGLNGAGKSTTINILCSIINKDSGEVIIDGFNIDKDSEKIKSKIGIVFQKSVLDNELTVLQNLYSRASLYPLSKEEATRKIEELTRLLELEKLLKRPYGKLSGGQRRKVDIARALLHSPEILFLDEPTTGLDPTTRLTVWEALNNLKAKTDLTIFLTTHYMEEVAKADYVVILDEGLVSASGSPDELKSRYTSDILRVISEVDSKMETMIEEEQLHYLYRSGAYEIDIKNAKAGVALVKKYPTLIQDFEILKGNMDHVFLNVTGKKIEQNDEKP